MVDKVSYFYAFAGASWSTMGASSGVHFWHHVAEKTKGFYQSQAKKIMKYHETTTSFIKSSKIQQANRPRLLAFISVRRCLFRYDSLPLLIHS